MDAYTRETGSRIKCKVKANIGGQMGVTIRENTLIIKNMAWEGTLGPIRRATMANGTKDNSMGVA